jgi:putative hydrolase of HD superfamily
MQEIRKIDLGKVLKMLSIHDVVEIDAGDTFLFDDKANEGKFDRELFKENFRDFK